MGGIVASPVVEVPKVKLLLLGDANVGKSTIFRQMQLLYKGGFDDQDREGARNYIVENVLEALVQLDAATDDLGVEVLEENEDLVDEIKPELLKLKARQPDQTKFTISVWDSVERLWRDPGIQAVFQEIQRPTGSRVEGSDKAMPEVLGYFLRQVDRIRRDDYMPSDDDILHLRQKSSEAETLNFRLDVASSGGKKVKMEMEWTDVGGQLRDRSEWSRNGKDLDAVIFVISLGNFSCTKSGGQNALDAQLQILRDVRDSEHFKGAELIVLLNKVDLLRTSLEGVKVSNYFPDFEGSNEIEDVLLFFKEKVVAALFGGDNGTVSRDGSSETSKLSEQSSQVITTCATDTTLMKNIIEKIGLSVFKTLNDSKLSG